MFTPRGFEPAYSMPAVVPADAIVFAFRGDRILLTGSAEALKGGVAPTLPCFAALTALGLSGTAHFLGMLDGASCIAVDLPADTSDAPGWHFAGLRSLFFRL